jgi:hypothetical protein
MGYNNQILSFVFTEAFTSVNYCISVIPLCTPRGYPEQSELAGTKYINNFKKNKNLDDI